MKNRLYTDFFLHFDITVMLIVNFICFIITIFWDFTLLSLLFYAIGIVTFTVSEYFTHRFIFHLKTPKNQFLLKLLKRLHYDHHSTPNDLKLLFLPLWYSIPNFIILCTICFLIVSQITLTMCFAVGVMTMFLMYEWKHYIAHRPIKPNTSFGRYIKKIHLLHHFKNENYWYGVSNPVMDAVFKTLKDEKKVETSETAKNLEKR